MQQFVHLTPPTEGAAITRRGGELVVPDAPIVPFIEGDGTGPDIWKASVRVFDAAVAKALRRQEEDRLVRGAGRREGQGAVRRVAAERHHRGGQALQGRHQGPADHARRRRHPQPERDAAPGARPLRVRAPGPLLRGHPGAGQASRPDERRHLPREHRGRLRRHRVGDAARRRPSASSSSSRRRWASASGPTPASASSRCPSSARSAWCARRSSTPSPTSARR